MLRHPDLSKVFEVACDASDIGIGDILSQDGHLVAYFSEKLNEAKLRYSKYDKEFYAVVQSLRHWCYYFLPKKFFPILIVKDNFRKVPGKPCNRTSSEPKPMYRA